MDYSCEYLRPILDRWDGWVKKSHNCWKEGYNDVDFDLDNELTPPLS